MSLIRNSLRFGGGGAFVPITPGVYDDLTGSAAQSLHGKTTTFGGLTWAAVLGNSGVTNQVKLDGTGEAYGLGTSGTTATSPTLLSPGYADNQAYRYRISPKAGAFGKAGAGSVIVDATYTGDGTTNLWSKSSFGPASIGVGAVTYKGYAATGAQGASTGTIREGAANPGVYNQPGDNYEWRQKNTAGVITRDEYQNGRLMFVGTFDYGAGGGSGVALTGNFGISGVLEVAGSRPLSDVWVTDRATQGWLSVDRPARVAQLNDDGSLTLNLYGEYNLTAPTGLKISVYDGVTEVLLTGMGSVALASFVASAGVWSGNVNIVSGVLPASHGPIFCRVERDLGSGNFAYDFTCLLYPGEVMEVDGQSLSENGFLVIQAPVVPYGLVCDGNKSGTQVAEVDKRYMPEGTGSNPHSYASNVMGIMGAASGLPSSNLCLIRTCRGGTFLQDPVTQANGREVGTTNWTGTLASIKRAGNRHSVLLYTGGQFEAIGSNHLDMTTVTNQQNYVNALIAQINAKEAITGKALKVILSYGGFNGSTSASVDVMRRINYWLAFTYPTRFFIGPHYSDLTHGMDGALGTDTYHPSTVAFLKYGNRKGYSWAKARGYATVDRAGPFPVSLTRNSASSVTLRVNKNGATTADVINTAVNSDFSGGALFSDNDSTFGAGNLKTPTGYSVVDVDATYADITWTFAALTFLFTVYFKIHTGGNPFNRTDNATIAAAIETQASMLVGVYSDDKVACQPYYSFANPALQAAYTADWLSAS